MFVTRRPTCAALAAALSLIALPALADDLSRLKGIVNETGADLCQLMIIYGEGDAEALEMRAGDIEAGAGRVTNGKREQRPFMAQLGTETAPGGVMGNGSEVILHLVEPGCWSIEGMNCVNDAVVFRAVGPIEPQRQIVLVQGEAEPEPVAPVLEGWADAVVKMGEPEPCPEVEFTAVKTDAWCEAFIADEYRQACEAATARRVKLGREAPFCGLR